jgi:hypothetical protein
MAANQSLGQSESDWSLISDALSQLLDEVHAQRALLSVALESSRSRAERGSPHVDIDEPTARSHWQSSLAQVSSSCTKLSIMAKMPSNSQDAVPFVDLTRAALPPLLIAFLALLDSLGASSEFTFFLTNLLESLFDALENLSNSLLLRDYDGERIAQRCGVVWRDVEALQSAPLNEREAAARAWHVHSSLTLDAHQELKDALNTANEDRNAFDEVDDNGSDDDEAGGLEGRVSNDDIAVVQPTVALLQLVAFMLQQLERLLSAPLLWSHLKSASELGVLCDDLAVLCYTPVDRRALQTHFNSVRNVALSIVSALRTSAAEFSVAQGTLISGIEAKLRDLREPNAGI